MELTPNCGLVEKKSCAGRILVGFSPTCNTFLRKKPHDVALLQKHHSFLKNNKIAPIARDDSPDWPDPH
jgi:hypothetical protein